MPGVVIPLDGVLLRVVVDGTGDFDGDGFGDVVVFGSEVNETALYFGAAIGPAFALRRVLSERLCITVGDVNGDGLSDLVSDGLAGTDLIYGASRSTIAVPIVNLPGTSATSYSGVGDINGDGYADLALDVGTLSSLRRRIYLGAATGAPVGGWSASVGVELAPLGDTNGDGFADVALLSDSMQQMQVYTGSGTGEPSLIGLVSYSRSELFGTGSDIVRGVVAVGDVNGDAYRDVAIGAPGIRSVFLFHGRPAGFPSVATTTLTEGMRAGFGDVVAMTLWADCAGNRNIACLFCGNQNGG